MLTMNFKIGLLFLKLVILFYPTVILFRCASSILFIAIKTYTKGSSCRETRNYYWKSM